MAALTIRKDRTPVMLRKLAKAEEDARVGRRMLAIANALDGMSREAAAQAAGMDRQTLRDWVIRYNENGIDGLLDRWDGGRPPRLEPDELAELYAIVMAGPDPEIDGVWWKRGERPPGLCDKRFTFAYIFAAVEPGTDNAFALVLPYANTEAMQEFLDQFAATIGQDEHIVLILDQAGWHGAGALRVPAS